MLTVGIDVAKDKHDCCILTRDGERISFVIANNRDGFNTLFEKIAFQEDNAENIRIGLESTGPFSRNILKFLINSGITTFLFNPLYAKEYHRNLIHRSTKTDKLDAYVLADMLMSGRNLKPYCTLAYRNEEIKSLTRFRLTFIRRRAYWKTSLRRYVVLLFPEPENIISDVQCTTVYTLLSEMPGASHIAEANITRPTNLLRKASRGYFGKDTAEKIREAAGTSIGSTNPAHSFELKKVIEKIKELDLDIADMENEIHRYIPEEPSICSIPGMGKMAAAAIVGEIGYINRFETSDRLIAFAGISPTTYQSGKVKNCHSHMEKRGSRYLRHVLYNTARQMTLAGPRHKECLKKKLNEGKHYYVAISHVMKRLVRLLFVMLKTGEQYVETV